ncbi:MAG: hypothetical protein WCR23_06575 [Planctomycetota bacterium]|nr:hypothetical protein [Pirellulales bacterium]TSA09314.1 MAG: hypothetical protein D4R77_01055 [Planctomycetaceae bacterium]
MWKTIFLAAGIFSCLLGVEFLVIDSATILSNSGNGGSQAFSPPDWAPWSFISVGAVLILNVVSGHHKSASE